MAVAPTEFAEVLGTALARTASAEVRASVELAAVVPVLSLAVALMVYGVPATIVAWLGFTDTTPVLELTWKIPLGSSLNV